MKQIRKTVDIVLPLLLLLAGITLAVMGIWRGELQDILRKAVVICLECIGIG